MCMCVCGVCWGLKLRSVGSAGSSGREGGWGAQRVCSLEGPGLSVPLCCSLAGDESDQVCWRFGSLSFLTCKLFSIGQL